MFKMIQFLNPHKDKYNLDLADAVGNAVEVSSKSDIYGVSGLDLKWYWSGEEQFMSIAREFHLMNELKVCLLPSTFCDLTFFTIRTRYPAPPMMG